MIKRHGCDYVAAVVGVREKLEVAGGGTEVLLGVRATSVRKKTMLGFDSSRIFILLSVKVEINLI